MPDEVFAQVKTYPRFELGWNRLQALTKVVVALLVVAGLFGPEPPSSAAVEGTHATLRR